MNTTYNNNNNTNNTVTYCEYPRCNKTAEFCFEDEPNVPRFCCDHKIDTMIPVAVKPQQKSCEYPRCNAEALYTFVDDIATPHFCHQHKSPGMFLANGVGRPYNNANTAGEQHIPIIPAVPVAAATTTTARAQPGFASNAVVSEASLELAHQYFAIKPEYDSLESVQRDARAHRQTKLDPQKQKVQREVKDLQTTTQSIEKLEQQIQKQESKFIDCFGKSIFGIGLLMKDQKVIDKKRHQLTTNTQHLEELQTARVKDDQYLTELQKEQKRLDDLVEIRLSLESRIQQLRSECLDKESTSTLRRLQSNHELHERMQQSLQWCRKDVATAHQLFQKALSIQAVAARSNAMAAGANIGQAIGGGGGRGIGQSPGERLLQIRRNQATKQSIELARQAAETLNTAQDRLANELRVHFASEMAGVGIIQVPDLWHGSFFRDFLVGQAAGNIGDAINQGRAMMKIRKNMETLEAIIGACAQQQQQLLVVQTKLDSATQTLADQVLAEEKQILDRVIEVAKAQQQQQQKQRYQQEPTAQAAWQPMAHYGNSFKLPVY